jgi:hypothetical protein
MEFLVIMGVGTAIAVWAVIGTRPRLPVYSNDESFLADDDFPPKTQPWRKDISRSLPMGEQEYLESVERYQDDPQHEPFPLLPPTRRTRNGVRD